jgi:hypothetical protein
MRRSRTALSGLSTCRRPTQLGHPVLPHCGVSGGSIDNAVEPLPPGGTLFIGDVRNHALQGALQTAVALARTATSDAAEIRQRVRCAMLGEPELPLAPEIFTVWAAEHPLVAGLDIDVKLGVADNELSRYRYDVTIHQTPHWCARWPAHPAGRGPTARACAGCTPGCYPTPHRRSSHRHPPGQTDQRRPHQGALADGLPLAVALAQASATATLPHPNNCTASTKPPDATSPSPGAQPGPGGHNSPVGREPLDRITPAPGAPYTQICTPYPLAEHLRC